MVESIHSSIHRPTVVFICRFKCRLFNQMSQLATLITSFPITFITAENTKLRASITVQMTYCLFCLDSAVLLIYWISNIFPCLVKSKPVKQEVSCTFILPPMASIFCLCSSICHFQVVKRVESPHYNQQGHICTYVPTALKTLFNFQFHNSMSN